MKLKWLLPLSLLVASCGPQGNLASPEQNVAERFVAREGMHASFNWTEPGSPVVLSLSEDGPHEMMWTVREKAMRHVRRSRIASLQLPPRFFSQGPDGVREVRFSPSGTTILAHEFAPGSNRFQTVLFQMNDIGVWRSRYLDLGKAPETKLRKLDDRTKVAAILAPAVAPKILRLDDRLVIYEVDGKTNSLEL